MEDKGIKRDTLPQALRDKKPKTIKYQGKDGIAKVIPIVMVFLSMIFLTGLATATGLAHCQSVAPSETPSDCSAIVINGTSGINTDVWLLDGTATGFTITHWNWSGSESLGSPWNCSHVNTDVAYAGAMLRNSTSIGVVSGWGLVQWLEPDCSNPENMSLSAGETVKGAATSNRSAVTEIWESLANGSIYHFRTSDGAELDSCSVTGASDCYGLAINSDASLLYLDCGWQNNIIYVVDQSCNIQATWDMTDIVVNTTTTDTTDGEHFWSWDYANSKIVRWANDSTAPTIKSVSANMTYIGRNWTIELTGAVYDSCNCTMTYVSSNESGTMLTVTGATSNTTVGVCGDYSTNTFDWSNTTYYCGLDVGYKICAEDTSGNTNCSEVSTFYRMPYMYKLSGVTVGTPTCTNEYDVSWTSTSAGTAAMTVYAEFQTRNATMKECAYFHYLGTKNEITNTSTYCVINGTQSIGSGFQIRVKEDKYISAHEPSNLPAALATLSFGIIIVVYSYARRR